MEKKKKSVRIVWAKVCWRVNEMVFEKTIWCIVQPRKYTKWDKDQVASGRYMTKEQAGDIAYHVLSENVLNVSTFDMKYQLLERCTYKDNQYETRRLSTESMQKKLHSVLNEYEKVVDELMGVFPYVHTPGLKDNKDFFMDYLQHGIGGGRNMQGKKRFSNISYRIYKFLSLCSKLSKDNIVDQDIFLVTDAHLPVNENVFINNVLTLEYLNYLINQKSKARRSWVVPFTVKY